MARIHSKRLRIRQNPRRYAPADDTISKTTSIPRSPRCTQNGITTALAALHTASPATIRRFLREEQGVDTTLRWVNIAIRRAQLSHKIRLHGATKKYYIPSKRSTTTGVARKPSQPKKITAPPANTAELSSMSTGVNLKGYDYGSAPPSNACLGELDLVFAIDCTASMGSTIHACKKDIVAIASALRAQDGLDVRVGLIPYRDHHASEQYTTRVYPFTRSADQMLQNVSAQSAAGGGDTPEAVAAAMFDALNMQWREGAAKQVIFMADAGPHGLQDTGDSYPNGDPQGKCPLTIAREMHSLGIVVHTAWATSHSAAHSSVASWFFSLVAHSTGGLCVPLKASASLASVVLDSTRDAVRLEGHVRAVDVQLQAKARAAGRVLTAQEVASLELAWLASSLQRGTQAALAQVSQGEPLEVMAIPGARLAQALAVEGLGELKAAWAGPDWGLPGVDVRRGDAERVTAMRGARAARPSGKPVLECHAGDKGKVRVRVVSEGYDATKNVQFPKDIRAVGRRFEVEQVVDAGSFYCVRGEITQL